MATQLQRAIDAHQHRLRRRAALGTAALTVLPQDHGGWTARWSLGDRLSISLSIISITLILLAPLLADQTFAETWSIILEELHPYPVD